MKIKLSNLYDLSLGLNDLADKELPIALAFKVQRLQKVVSGEVNRIRQSKTKK